MFHPNDPATKLNRITQKEAIQEIGNDGWRRFCSFSEWLNPGSDSRIFLRYAPSIIMRSELEVFSISSPRFAIRAYFGPNWSNLVNLRRIAGLCRQVRTWHAYEKSMSRDAIQELLARQNPI